MNSTRAQDGGWGIDLEFAHAIAERAAVTAMLSVIPEFGSPLRFGEYRIVGVAAGIQREIQGVRPFGWFYLVPYVTARTGPQTMTSARQTAIGRITESFHQAWFSAGGGARLLGTENSPAALRVEYTIGRRLAGSFASGYVHKLSVGFCLRILAKN